MVITLLFFIFYILLLIINYTAEAGVRKKLYLHVIKFISYMYSHTYKKYSYMYSHTINNQIVWDFFVAICCYKYQQKVLG